MVFLLLYRVEGVLGKTHADQLHEMPDWALLGAPAFEMRVQEYVLREMYSLFFF